MGGGIGAAKALVLLDAFVRVYSGDANHRLEADTAVFVDHRQAGRSRCPHATSARNTATTRTRWLCGNAFLLAASAAVRLNRRFELYAEAQNLGGRRYLSGATTYGPPSAVIVGVRTAHR